MITHLYTICWNEADLLPFFFRHHDSWVDRYVFYDDGSSDDTLTLLQAHPRVEVRPFPRSDPTSFVESHRALQNSVWKESRGNADWVVITAVDEHLHHPRLGMDRYLQQCREENVTYIPALGYQMISEDFPQAHEWLCESRTWGAPFWIMSKLSIFNPGALEETGFSHGRHIAEPVGQLRLPTCDEILLCHYKHLGFERTWARQRFLQGGLREKDLAMGWGYQYGLALDKYRASWDDIARKAIDLLAPSFQPEKYHLGLRWWRETLCPHNMAAHPSL